MKFLQTEYPFLVALTAGVGVITLLLGYADRYVTLAALGIFLAVFVVSKNWQDRGFYLVCGAQPLVVACGITNPGLGVFAVCMVAGIVYSAWGLLDSGNDLVLWAGFCGASIAAALLLLVSNHVLPALLAIGGTTAIILLAQSVRTYQFRRQYRGARP